jgi:hypothetical protein
MNLERPPFLNLLGREERLPHLVPNVFRDPAAAVSHRYLRIGIEFLHLDDGSLAQFARWLETHSPRSFIPKDCSRSPSFPPRLDRFPTLDAP